MSNSYMDATANTEFIPEVIANFSIGKLGAYLSLGKTVTPDSELTTAQQGQVISVPKRAALSANQKTENENITMQKPTATNVTVTLNQHWEVSFGEESYTKALQGKSVMPGYVDDAVMVLAEKIETLLAGLYSSFTHSVAEIAGGADPLGSLLNVRQAMSLQKVPRIAPRFAYLHPTFITKLLKATPYTDPKMAPNQATLMDGVIARVAGFDIFEGQLVSGSGSPSDYQNLCYTRGAMVLATRPLEQPDPGLGVQSGVAIDGNGIALRVLRSYNPNALATQITLDVLFGVAVLDDRLAQVFLTA